MELTLTTDLTALQPIEFNYDTLKAALDATLERYRNLVIEDGDIPDARKDRAELNKLKDSIDAERIKNKKLYLLPYDKFESKLKELTGMISKPADEIDKTIKAYEARVKKKKRDAIETHFNESVGELNSFLTLDMIYDKRWDTVAVKLPIISGEITERIKNIRNDVTTIKSMTLKHEAAVLGKYIETLNLSSALATNARLIVVEAATTVKVVPKVEIPIAPPIAIVLPPVAEEPPVIEDEPPTDFDEPPVVVTTKLNLKLAYTYTATMSPEQSKDLEDWFYTHNIQFKKGV